MANIFLPSCTEPGGGRVFRRPLHVHAPAGLPGRPHQHPDHLQRTEAPDQRRHQPALRLQPILRPAQQGETAELKAMKSFLSWLATLDLSRVFLFRM